MSFSSTCASPSRDADWILDCPLNFTSNSAWSSLRSVMPISFTRDRRICFERAEVLLMHILVDVNLEVR